MTRARHQKRTFRVTRRLLPAASAVAVGLTIALAGPAQADPGTHEVVHPSQFNPALSDTRATGHFEVEGERLHIWTEGTTSTDKVAEYLDTDLPLADAGDAVLDYTPVTPGTTPPGFQLYVDFDADGTADGILVGEKTYGDRWWLNNAAAQFVKDGAPQTGGGNGSNWFGTLEQWDAAFPGAEVTAFGFSLGSGVKGDGYLDAIRLGGTTYTFAPDVVLTAKDECKQGGWATSTVPVYENQGECVSSFASAKAAQHAGPAATKRTTTPAVTKAPARAAAKAPAAGKTKRDSRLLP